MLLPRSFIRNVSLYAHMVRRGRGRSMKNLIAVCAVVVLMLVCPVGASQFLSINFDGDNVGSAPATGGTGNVGALGGYTATNAFNPPSADCGTVVVDNVAGMSKAAVLTTNPNNGVVGALFMDTALGLVSSQISIAFDISVLASPTSATAQAPYFINGTTDTAGVLFGARVYASSSAQWAFSFAVSPTSENGGVFALRDITNTQIATFGSYVEGQKYNITLAADYTLGTVNAYVDGVLGFSGYPLRTGAVATPVTSSELFMYFNGQSGYANQVAVDNIQGFNTAIPEPITIALLGLGGLMMRKRK